MMIDARHTINMAYNALNSTSTALERTTRALSTGLKAAVSRDDASGVAISTSISAQVAGVDRAVRNSQDGISLLQTAEGGLGAINSMLQRMRELTMQAANDTLTIQDRGYLQLEVEEIRRNIDNVANTTTFNNKRLLDGSSSAIWSSDDAATKLKVTGAITEIDQFGQKKQLEGNYRIDIKAKPGQAEVQKTSIFTMRRVEQRNEAVVYDYEIDITTGEDLASGKTSGKGWTFENGELTITGDGNYSIVGNSETTSNHIVVKQGVYANVKLKDVDIASGTGSAFQITGSNVKVVLEGENFLRGGSPEQAGLEVRNALDNGPKGSVEINSIGGFGSTEGKLTATGAGCGAGIGGSCHSPEKNVGYSVGEITINGGTIIAQSGGAGAGIGGGGHFSDHPSEEVGAHVRITINGGDITATGGGAGIGSGTVCPNDDTNVDFININGGKIKATAKSGSAAIGGGAGANSGVIKVNRAAELDLDGWIDTAGGATLPIGRGIDGAKTGQIFSNVEYFGSSYPTLEQINEFYTSDGIFMVKEPQTITITQGSGETAKVVLYSNDTIEDVRRKLNNAIAFDLGQSAYTDNADNFVSYVENPQSQGLESVKNTFVIRSAVAGKTGQLKFSAESNDLINAFGLSTIQTASENVFTASVYNAHTGNVIASNIEAEGNVLVGALGPNASIEFDAMANVKAEWNEASRSFSLNAENGVYSTTLHISDRSTSFQVGQNEGEDIYISIGDMRSDSLGLDRVDILTRANAASSITLIDAAIHKVSIQRSRVGAYQNELEYNANSLRQAGIFFQAAESRIKDADMATEYMEFVKFQILNQTGNSMLSQASQNARSIMNVLAQ